VTQTEQEAQRRRLDAWGGADRVLAPVPGRERISDRLARLAREGAGTYGLDDWTDQYGNGDSVVGELERRTAAVLGMEAAA
jgi:hypothetical protein